MAFAVIESVLESLGVAGIFGKGKAIKDCMDPGRSMPALVIVFTTGRLDGQCLREHPLASRSSS